MVRVFGAPSRYVQGPGALSVLPNWCERLGGRPAIVTDAVVLELLGPALAEAFAGREAPALVPFAGEITFATIERTAAAARDARPGVVVGLGGGKALDVSKGVARALGLPVVTAPTIASNDAPTSKAIAVYDDNHSLVSVEQMERNPDVVLVDTALIVKAPPRFLRAGIGDAIAKKFEADAAANAGARTMHGTRPLWTALHIADGCYETIRAHALGALAAVARGEPDEAFERVVEASILLSGLGFENGGLSLAHSMTRGLMVAPGTARSLHGEHVAYALLVQLLLEPRPEAFVADLLDFYRAAGLPASLRALGMAELDAAQLALIAERTMTAPHIRNLPRPVDAAMIVAAMRDLESRAQ